MLNIKKNVSSVLISIDEYQKPCTHTQCEKDYIDAPLLATNNKLTANRHLPLIIPAKALGRLAHTAHRVKKLRTLASILNPV